MYNTPVRFDENEWVVLVSALVLLIVFIRLPKIFPPILMAIIWLFFSYLGSTTDQLLGTGYWLDLYDTMDTNIYDWYDILIYTLSYPLYGYLYCHFYKAIKGFHPRYLKLYIFGWSALTTLLEWFSALLGVFTYKGWHPYYSFPFYLLLFTSIPFFLLRLERWWQREKQLQKNVIKRS